MSNTLKFGAGKWAAKEGSVLAYNDLNDNFKPLPFTFTRASTATRVNESGLIEIVPSGVPRIDFLDNPDGHLLLEPSRTNSLPYSEDFSSWQTSNFGTLTSGQTGFDGSNNAWLYEYTANAAIVQQSNTSSGVQTFSVFAKGSVQNGIRLYAFGTSNANTYFNLNLGTIGATSGATSNSIEDYGNGWYKCSMTFDQTNSNIYLYLTNNQNSLASSGSAYIQYAQLENGSYATSYIPTSGSSVTRAAEDQSSNLNVIPLNIGNSYTLFFDVDLNTFENNKVFFALSNSAGTLSFTIRNNVGGVRLYDNIGASYPVAGILSDTNKFVLRIDGTSYKIFVSGTSLSGSIGTARNLGYLGSFLGSNTELKVNEFKLYDNALSDSECQSLVS